MKVLYTIQPHRISCHFAEREYSFYYKSGWFNHGWMPKQTFIDMTRHYKLEIHTLEGISSDVEMKRKIEELYPEILL